ncbi:MAG: hypothetical protein HYX72_12415 [Acidobacteria bacterium]|nr:hypothetical protein [Acidobacteriota bacterium]
MEAPLSELPELTEDEKEVARKFGIADEKYARSRLSLVYGHKRQEERGHFLGEVLKHLLAVLGTHFRLRELIYDPEKSRWVAKIEGAGRISGVSISRELAEDIIDINTVQDQERLRDLLIRSLHNSGSITGAEHK